MHWTDLLAIVPLFTLVYFVLGLRGLFKRDLHIRIVIGLCILTGVIRSFTNIAAFQVCFILLVAGIIVAALLHKFIEKPPQR